MSAVLLPRWPRLSAPVFPAQTHSIYQAMSALTRDGRVPSYEEAARYAAEQSAPKQVSRDYAALSHGE